MSEASSFDSGSQVVLPPHLQEALESVATQNGFRKPRYDVRSGTKPGDNYGSVIYRVGIADEEASARTLSVIVKGPVPITDAGAKYADLFSRCYRNETTAYNLVFASYAEKLRERGLLAEGSQYPDAPACFMASAGRDGSVLILQDMRSEGFVMHERRFLDLQHCRVSLGVLANLHGHCLAMENLQPEEYQRLGNAFEEIWMHEEMIKMFDKDPLTKSTIEMIEKRFPEGTVLYEKAKEICSTAREDFTKFITPLKEGGNVVCHADCWVGNYLYKYSESGEVETACMLDFQICRFACPALDVLHFLFSCTGKELRDAHWDSLLRDDYHAKLQRRMRELGVEDPDAVYPWARFESQLKQFARYGLIMSLFTIPGLTLDVEKVPDVAAVLQDGDSMADMFHKTCSDSEERDRRVSNVFEEMMQRGFI